MPHKFSFTLQAKSALLTHDVAKIYDILLNLLKPICYVKHQQV